MSSNTLVGSAGNTRNSINLQLGSLKSSIDILEQEVLVHLRMVNRALAGNRPSPLTPEDKAERAAPPSQLETITSLSNRLNTVVGMVQDEALELESNLGADLKA